MAWNLETAKTRLGIEPGDMSKDTQIQAAMDTALSLCEKYCDRFFLQASETETFYHTSTNVFQLKRFPIVSVSKGGDGAKVYQERGYLEFSRYVIEEEVEVEYLGGYSELPADLEMALWLAFDNTYKELAPGGGGLSGGLKKLQITGVGSIDYGTSAASSGDSGGGFVGGLIPISSIGILDLYRLPGA